MRPVSAVPTPDPSPEEPHGWSFQALCETFAALVPGWLRRCGVRGHELEDAVQESLIAMWQRADEIPSDRGEARRALLRPVARIALRARRHAQRADARFVQADEAEILDPCDVEVWVEARALVLDALDVLDEGTRALLVAHDLEGCSNAELAKRFGDKEQNIKQRVIRGRQRLQREIESLLKGKSRKTKRNRSRAVMVPLGLAGLDPTDRAILCAVLDTERRILPLGGPPPPSGVFALVGGAGTLLGPVLAAVAAVLGTVAALLLVASLLPRLRPDVGSSSMRWGTAVEPFNATTTAAVGAAALVVAPPRGAVPPVQARASVPRSVAGPPVSPEELAARVAALRAVNVGRPPP
ncbi:RNA polymerase sigma factor [Polyangium fumosum]|uniref:RNA polymerase sigma factor n=1 Tax=Polyangium fumosum TaxID=889272 RepID=UPI0014794EF0|nr:sigma-70 family RNA polymerase sigma factor [Polyangium fumosum]